MRSIPRLMLVASLLLGAAAPALALGMPKPVDLPTVQAVPDAHPYDTSADAHAQLDAAFKAARLSGRKVLIDFGANWCPDCRMLNEVMQMPQVKPWRDSHFETVMINVDRFNVNMDIPAKYGVKVKQIPTVLIVTPEGKVLNPDGTLTLGNARTMTPQAQVDLISAWGQRGS